MENEEVVNPKVLEALEGPKPICRHSYEGPTGIVWICIREVHATEVDIKAHGYVQDQQGRWPQHMRHLFVNKYPYRNMK